MTPVCPTFPTLLQDFFGQRLIAQRQASPRTVAAYRDAFRLLLGYAQNRLHTPASALTLAQLDAPLILDFLDHLETARQNSARTRNARLAALRSFLHYAALRDPTALAVIQRVLAIPTKRFDRPLLGYLSREEMKPFSPRRIAPPGAVTAITSCSPRCTTPGRACPRSSLCGSAMSSSITWPTCA